ncbi:DCC1-like thiol-disulfide oxidoreductase family protein [Culturomica sp.]|uniref:thiol-disulfide oxidoreductase DCC family protein n=1 Tax=Culturomica sp. TaxID=1926652 RepID=UPI00257FE29A|nr:DCC1-like thiol-disulfide oxidoreductase family protein [Culturomica sp.]
MQTILFDGYCNLCSSSVRFVRRRNSAASFHFIPLQSEAGQRLLQKNGINIKENSTVVYIKDNRYFLRSSALLHICKDLGKGWQFIYYSLVPIPTFIRDPVYTLLARLRYRIWGRRNRCFLPPPSSRPE